MLRLDIVEALREWDPGDPARVSDAVTAGLFSLYQLFQKEAFAAPERLERELALDLEPWQLQALPVGTGSGHEAVLVEALQSLVAELQSDARRVLTGHLDRYDAFLEKSQRLTDEATEPAAQQLEALRMRAQSALENGTARVLGLEGADVEALSLMLSRVEQDPRAFPHPRAVLEAALAIINNARGRKYPTKKPWSDLGEVALLRDSLQAFSDLAFAWHQRQAALRQSFRDSLGVHNDYEIWAGLVRETMLGGLTEEQRRDEFALQAAYVIFIRLLLIRVCEDKGIFPNRFLTDGGLKHWQEESRVICASRRATPTSRCWTWRTRTPRTSTGTSSRARVVQLVHAQQEPFFAVAVSTQPFRLRRGQFGHRRHRLQNLCEPPEKKKKGQYYTPPEVVGYILDEVGYRSGPGIIGGGKRLIDPACGSGTFLVTAAKRLVAAYQKAENDPVTILARVRENLYGFDLNPFACYLAEVNLLIQVLDLGKGAD